MAIFLERLSADPPPEYPSLHSLLPACATQLFSCSLDTPIRPATTSERTRADDAIRHLARPGFNHRTLIPPLFEDVVRIRASGELYSAAKELERTPEIGWTAVRFGVTQTDPRGLQGRQLAPYPRRCWSYIPNRNTCQCDPRGNKWVAATSDGGPSG